jgi:hypothetical protein
LGYKSEWWAFEHKSTYAVEVGWNVRFIDYVKDSGRRAEFGVYEVSYVRRVKEFVI